MKFADKESENLLKKTRILIYYLPKYLEEYEKCDDWAKRRIICQKALKCHQKAIEEDFDYFGFFVYNYSAKDFIAFKDQEYGMTILDLFSAMTTLKIIFEQLLEFCNLKLGLSSRFIDGLNDWIAIYYKNIKYNFHDNTQYNAGVDYKIIESCRNKWLKLPSENIKKK